ncbi:hypothetical protein CCO2228_1698 [Campylobacter coli]|nr:hypothetical protein CCO2228_1698 [Campylobacter coli]
MLLKITIITINFLICKFLFCVLTKNMLNSKLYNFMKEATMTQVFKNSNSIQVKEQKNKENHFNLMLQLSLILN